MAVTRETISCYIRNLITNTNIEFELIPEEFTETNSATFDPHNIRGRSSPLQGYNSSGPRTLNYTLQLYDDYCKDGILLTVNKIKALTYPEYGGAIIPPKCYIRFGGMINMQGVVSNVSVNWKKPFRKGIFINADVSIDITEVVDKPKSAYEIETGKEREVKKEPRELPPMPQKVGKMIVKLPETKKEGS